MSGKFQNINFDLDKLPTMPLVAAQMMELINSPETSANALAKVVSKDPAVSARVLKIANSSFYSMSRQVSSLSTAVVILGERTLKNLVMAASMRGMNQSFGKVEQMLWEDSIMCALGSRYLARRLAIVDPEEAFMAGLFRHIGLTVLNNQKDKADEFIIRSMQSGNQSMAEQEREKFGATHAEIGAAVLEHWKLSEALSLVALHHSDVDFTEDVECSTVNMTAIVNIAGQLPRHFGLFGQQHEIDLDMIPGVKYLKLDLEYIEDVIDDFHNIFEENLIDFLS
jgi:HD-like signal output (HDOD) protein